MSGGVDLDPDRPQLRIAAIEWVRIQLVLRLRPDGDLAGSVAGREAPALLLVRERADGAGDDATDAHGHDRMAPTRSRWDGADLVARFNVMQGPGQVPLAAGTWRLAASVVDDATGPRTVEIEDPQDIVAGIPRTVFATPRGNYAVALRYNADLGFQVRVAVEAGPDRSPASGDGPRGPSGIARRVVRRIVRRIGRAARRLRRASFLASIAVFRRVVARPRPAILFTSSTRPALGGNLAVVHDRMVERGLDRGVDVRFWFKPDVHASTPLRDRIRAPWLLARSDLIVVDDFHPLLTDLDDPRVKIVQLWHASGVVKTILYSRIGKPGGPDPWSRDYKNYTHAIVSADGDIPHFAEAFGIPEDRVVATGIPRMDRFFDEGAREAGREAALAAFPAARGRRVILFAPTFRGAGRTKSYDLDALDYPALHELCVEKDAVFIIRLHPRMRRPLGVPPALADRILDGSDVATDAPDILFATDLLVTDYSSIIFEYAILGRPMLFFAPDLDEYRESVDFYEPYESLVPGRIVRTMLQLVDAIRREDFGQERLAPFVARHIAHLDGRATDRVIDQLILPGLDRP